MSQKDAAQWTLVFASTRNRYFALVWMEGPYLELVNLL
jgi:hypothetical protein